MKENDIEFIQEFASTQLNMYSDGVMFAIMQNEKIIWSIASSDFTMESYQSERKIVNSIIEKSFQAEKEVTEQYYDDAEQKNMKVTVVPIIGENQEDKTAFITVVPVIHPLQKAFKDFAPIIAEIFSEGSLVSITNKNVVLDVNRSEKYDIPAVVPGFSIADTEVDQTAMLTRKCVHADDDTLIYGPPIRVIAAPYFDKDSNEIVGAVNILRPKQAELDLKNLSADIERNLSDAVDSIQEIATISNSIHTNEIELNQEIEEITDLANQIVKISNIIKSIADSTKMLGLNASIEAARVGSIGRGFGVVAEEINKLSEQSKNTVPKIQKLTDDIKEKVEEAKRKSSVSLSSSEGQVASTEEISAVIESIQSSSMQLANIAKSI